MKNEKQCQILDCAIKVFARFGLRKTSIDDIAKAADMSRQGVYLHFKNKDEIFKASIEKYIGDRLAASNAALQETGSLDERLLRALDEWYGISVGFLHEDARDVMEQGTQILGDSFKNVNAEFKGYLTKALVKDKVEKKMAGEIAEILSACGATWKHELSSREELNLRMKSAIRICLHGIRG